MKIRTTVLCLPVSDVHKSLGFYQSVFGFSEAQIEDGMITLEFPNLSLFLMSVPAFEEYSLKAKRPALLPGAAAPAVLSCAVESMQDVDSAIANASLYGGGSAGTAADDALSGGYIGYVTDPDGHLWELVWPKPQQ